MTSRKIVRVRDVMQDQFMIIDGMLTVTEALSLLKQSNARVLIIDKRHSDDEFGIVLLTDIAREVLAQDRSPERVNVYEIMTKPVVSILPDMDIRYCARLLNNTGFSYVPVIENDEVKGVVGYSAMLLDGLCAEL